MRAKFVNEKFKEESDPIKDLGIGYEKRQLDSKSWKVLEFIESKGEEGASFTEIQHFIWTKLNNKSEEDFWRKGSKKWSYIPGKGYSWGREGTRLSRGYWTSQLYGTGETDWKGLLPTFCKKNEKGKWVLKRMLRPKEKFYRKGYES
jgi:hypothetical protein